MYLHIGGDTSIRTDDIIGIFDMDNSTVSLRTRNFLSQCEKEGRVINVSSDLPRSFIICREKEDNIVYICQLSPATLIKRADNTTSIGE